jgi:hypothetical protein
MTINFSRCTTCRYYLEDGRCKAFPNGIPKEILFDNKEHNEVREDQEGGYVFVVAEDLKDLPRI